jgi:hypothetical protein
MVIVSPELQELCRESRLFATPTEGIDPDKTRTPPDTVRLESRRTGISDPVNSPLFGD